MINYQIDYIKLSINNVDFNQINWDNLVDHPNLKRHYTLSSSLSIYYGKNFDFYYDNRGNVTLRMSIPYFLYNHNYVAINTNDLQTLLTELGAILNIDLNKSIVKEFEYAGFDEIFSESNQYIKSIIGISDFDLQKSTSYMKMYDSRNGYSYKIYDAVANAKKKKTFSRGSYPNSGLIKHELKFTSIKHFLKEEKELSVTKLLDDEFIEMIQQLLKSNKENIVLKKGLTIEPIKNDLTNILFATIKNMEQGNICGVIKMSSDIINYSDMSPSQKSKRRKAILELEKQYNRHLQKR